MNVAIRPIPAESLTHLIRRFLCERYWLPVTDYPLCGDVFTALGITGDDCHEFMENFSLSFNVDLTDFVWPRYHLSEAEAQDVRALLRPLLRLAGLKMQPMNRDLIPISIDHLQLVAELGRWVDPDPHAEGGLRRAGLSRSLSRFSARLKAGGIPRTHSR